MTNRRHLRIGSVGLLGLSAAPAWSKGPDAPDTEAPDTPAAEVLRTDKDHVVLSWTGLGREVDVRASTDADAPISLMRLFAKNTRATSIRLPLSGSPRPYFLVQDSAGRRVSSAERLLPLEGGRNCRDLGGYRTADNRQVRWGRMFRSGVLSGLSAADNAYLSGLEIETVCDLRTEAERRSEPAAIAAPFKPEITAYGYDMYAGSMGALFGAKTREDAIRLFAATYLEMTDFLAPNFTHLFDRLVHDDAPLLLNCTAGKDRTGVASALILSVLGVPRETIIADYALSQKFVPPEYYASQGAGSRSTSAALPSQQQAMMARMPEGVMRIIMGSDPDVMRQALDLFDQKAGGPVELVKSRYGVDQGAINHLRVTLLS
jgi:protein-tyrosine phosphatase